MALTKRGYTLLTFFNLCRNCPNTYPSSVIKPFDLCICNCLAWVSHCYFIFIKILFIYFYRGREEEGEKRQCVVASHLPPTGDLAHNPGMCPDWESNLLPFGSQSSAQSTEPHHPGLIVISISNPLIFPFVPEWVLTCFDYQSLMSNRLSSLYSSTKGSFKKKKIKDISDF